MPCTSTNSNATLFENAFFIGMNLQNILYGIQLVLYFKTMQIFLARRREPQKSDMFYAVFSSVMIFLITIWVATEAVFAQRMWLLHRNYPGGPGAYAATHTSDLYMDFGTTAVIILQQMTDGVMIYRCRILSRNHYAIIVPSIMWLANFVLGVLVVWASCTPGINFFSGIAAKLGMAYYTVSVFLNATLTSMICYRLMCHARTVKEYLEEKYVSPYFSIVMLLVESVLPYTLSGIAFLVSYGIGSQTVITFSCVYTLMMCVSPQMLILRVAEGEAWQSDTNKPPLSMIMFSPRGGDTLDSERCGNGTVHLESRRLSVAACHPSSNICDYM